MQPRSGEPRGGPGAAEEALVAAAWAVSERAHSPYSGVRVGAALRAANGRVYTGCNVESASYGLTICAERSALVQAVAAGAGPLERIAIVSNRAEPLMPCGACRQMLRELGGAGLRVVCVGAAGGRFEASVGELLPRAFVPEDLGRPPSEGGDA